MEAITHTRRLYTAITKELTKQRDESPDAEEREAASRRLSSHEQEAKTVKATP